MECSPPGSSVHGISQTRILEWVAISFSNGSSQPSDGNPVSWLASGFFTPEPPLKVKAQVTQSGPTLCKPIDYTIHGILQAKILVWVAFSFSKECYQPRDRTQVSHTAGRFFISWATREAQEYWVGNLSFLQQISGPRNRIGISCMAGRFFTNWAIREALSLQRNPQKSANLC